MDEAKTRAEWDAHMKFSQILPDYQTCLDRMAHLSSQIDPPLPLSRVTYGAHPRQWAEAMGTGDRAVIFVHGGYWRALRAEDHRFVLPGLGPVAAVVGNVEYRLIPEVRMAALVSDVRAALHRLLEATGVSDFVLVGHSAGAHLSLSALGDAALAARCAGAVLVSGVYDLHPVTRCFVQDELHLTEAEVTAHSLAQGPDDVPILVVTGADETEEFQRQSDTLAGATGAARLRVADTHHLNVIAELASPDTPFARALAAWCLGAEAPPVVARASA